MKLAKLDKTLILYFLRLILIAMSISSLYLDAFLAVAKTKGFSSAAKSLHITQSALSQRVKNLEGDLGQTLFIRTPVGANLTEQGERLLRYCQIKESMEGELLHDLNATKAVELTGTIKIASYSSVMRSVLIPVLKPLLEKHPNVLCEFICASMSSLPGLLERAEVDFIVMDYKLDKSNLQTVAIGQERYVLIESLKASKRNDIFLDNNSSDRATELFFNVQSQSIPKFRRSYFDDCYGIIDGVTQGLGCAVMPEHLVSKNNKIKIIKGYKPYTVSVVLHYYYQSFYPKLHQAVIQALSHSSKYL